MIEKLKHKYALSSKGANDPGKSFCGSDTF